MKPRRLAVYGLTAGLLGGGAAGLLMTGTTLASAQIADVSGTVTDPAATTDSTTSDITIPTIPVPADSGESTPTTAPETTTSSAPAASDPSTTTTAPADPATPAIPAPAAGAAKAPKNDWAKAALDKLVADGTISQAQADKVLAALDAARPAHGGKGGRGHGFGKLDAAAQVLGMTVDELRTALEGGKSLADVAKDKGIDAAKVVDALVAELKAHLAEHVASGKNTQAEVDQMLADARTRIEAFVNGQAPAGGPGFGGGHGHGGRRGPGGPGTGGAPANGTTPSSSSSGSGTTTS